MHVWLPDRPGALGQVASRIGAVGGDVVAIEILERGGGSAIDELVVNLPDDVPRDVLLAEIAQVDGAAVEDVRPIDPGRPDAGMAALEIAAVLIETEPDKRLDVFCDQLKHLVDGAWALALRSEAGAILVERGAPPDRAWLAAFFEGSRHLSRIEQGGIGERDFGDSAPSDMVWVHFDAIGVSVAAGRIDRPFHTRERQQVALLGRVADGLFATSFDGS